MNPRFGRIADRCHALAAEVRASGLVKAPSPDAEEEAVLACAVLMMMMASRERNPTADPVNSVCAAIVNLSRQQEITLEEAIEHVAGRIAAIWSANEPGRESPS